MVVVQRVFRGEHVGSPVVALSEEIAPAVGHLGLGGARRPLDVDDGLSEHPPAQGVRRPHHARLVVGRERRLKRRAGRLVRPDSRVLVLQENHVARYPAVEYAVNEARELLLVGRLGGDIPGPPQLPLVAVLRPNLVVRRALERVNVVRRIVELLGLVRGRERVDGIGALREPCEPPLDLIPLDLLGRDAEPFGEIRDREALVAPRELDEEVQVPNLRQVEQVAPRSLVPDGRLHVAVVADGVAVRNLAVVAVAELRPENVGERAPVAVGLGVERRVGDGPLVIGPADVGTHGVRELRGGAHREHQDGAALVAAGLAAALLLPALPGGAAGLAVRVRGAVLGRELVNAGLAAVAQLHAVPVALVILVIKLVPQLPVLTDVLRLIGREQREHGHLLVAVELPETGLAVEVRGLVLELRERDELR